LYLEHSDWDSESDEDNTSSEREELPTIVRVDHVGKKVDTLMCDCITVVNVVLLLIHLYI